MTWRLDRLWLPTWLKSGLRPGSFPAVSITLTATPNRPVWLDCPGPSHLPVRGDFGPLGRDFCAQVALTWSPRRAKVAILLQRGIEISKSHFSKQIVKNTTRSRQSDVQTVPKASRARPSEPQCAPKGVPGRQFWRRFRNILRDLSHAFSKLLPASNLEPKTTLRTPPNRQIHTEIVLETCANR